MSYNFSVDKPYKKHEKRFTITCVICNRHKNVSRETARTCSNACRMELSRRKKKGKKPLPQQTPPVLPAAAQPQPEPQSPAPSWQPTSRQVGYSLMCTVNDEQVRCYPVFNADGHYTEVKTSQGLAYLFLTLEGQKVALKREAIEAAAKEEAARQAARVAAIGKITPLPTIQK